MRLMMVNRDSKDVLGVVTGDEVALLADAPSLFEVIRRGPEGLKTLDQAMQRSSGVQRIPLADATPALPIAHPGKFLCMGLNFTDHAKEGNNPIPDYPALFIRVDSSLVPSGAPMVRPKASPTFDYEAELVIVIGKAARHVSEADALGHVFGYTIFNDGSVRSYQRKSTQWTAGKNFDGTGPLGPVVVTSDELPPGADGLAIRTLLNGEVMQDGNTGNMIFSVARTVSILSEIMTLEPGDLIAMGTPAGVGYPRTPPVFLKPGDEVVVEIEGIGRLVNPVVDEA